MRRFFRIIFNALAVLSLVLAVVVVGLWWTGTLIYLPAHPDAAVVAVRPFVGVGGNQVEVGVISPLSAPPPNYARERSSGIIRSVEWYPQSDAGTFIGRLDSVLVPVWLVVLGLCLLPSLRLTALLRSRSARIDSTVCPTCNYDLRATPDRCPECGAITSPSP